jgi:hypothetical protein
MRRPVTIRRLIDMAGRQTRGIPLKVIAINTSPERDRGVVSLLLDPFLDGLRESGAEVGVFYTVDGIHWLRQTGQADVLVLASPLFFEGLTGPEGATPSLKLLLDRLTRDMHSSDGRPPGRPVDTAGAHANPRQVVIASGCGFWVIENLSPATAIVEALCCGAFPEFSGVIAGNPRVTLRGAMPRGLLDWDIIGAARGAGCQMAGEEAMPPVAHDIARREAMTRDFYDRIMGGNTTVRAASCASPARGKCAQNEDRNVRV